MVFEKVGSGVEVSFVPVCMSVDRIWANGGWRELLLSLHISLCFVWQGKSGGRVGGGGDDCPLLFTWENPVDGGLASPPFPGSAGDLGKEASFGGGGRESKKSSLGRG